MAFILVTQQSFACRLNSLQGITVKSNYLVHWMFQLLVSHSEFLIKVDALQYYANPTPHNLAYECWCHWLQFQVKKLKTDLGVVRGNLTVMSDMMSQLDPATAKHSDTELLQVSWFARWALSMAVHPWLWHMSSVCIHLSFVHCWLSVSPALSLSVSRSCMQHVKTCRIR